MLLVLDEACYGGVDGSGYQSTLAEVVPHRERSSLTRCGGVSRLHQAAGPGDHSQSHAAALLLQHGHQSRVAHPHCGQAIDCNDHVTAPTEMVAHTHTHTSEWVVNRTRQPNMKGLLMVPPHSLEPAVIVRGCAQDDGLDEEGLVAVAFLVAPDDAEAPAARVAPPQHDLMAAVQVAERTAHQP